MSTKYFQFILVVFFSVFCFSQNNETKDSIRMSQKLYKRHLLNNEVEKAIKYIDSRTIKYYANILNEVKKADSTRLNSLDIMDRFMVLAIRNIATKEDIDNFDSKKLLIFSYEKNLSDKESIMNLSIGKVQVEGNFALGEILVKDNPSNNKMHFYKENSIWKLDLTCLFPMANKLFKSYQEKSGFSENEFLIELLKVSSKVSNNIWSPQ